MFDFSKDSWVRESRAPSISARSDTESDTRARPFTPCELQVVSASFTQLFEHWKELEIETDCVDWCMYPGAIQINNKTIIYRH